MPSQSILIFCETKEIKVSLKTKIYKVCIQQLDDEIAYLQSALNDLTEGAENDSKSSAGDKHETARAMIQIEHEKIGKQLNDTLSQKAAIEQIDPTQLSAIIGTGSLVKTNRAYLFMIAALGKMNVEGTDVMPTLSMQSPLGQKLSGLKAGDAAEINGTHYMIEEVL